MVDFSFLKGFWRKKTIRDLIVLIILLIIFIVSLSINLQSPPAKESERVLMCPKCKYTALMKFSDIKLVRCPKCHAKMEYAFKCRQCDYEFPYLDISSRKRRDMSLKELRERRIKDCRCPNCKSTDVAPISNYVWRHTNHD